MLSADKREIDQRATPQQYIYRAFFHFSLRIRDVYPFRIPDPGSRISDLGSRIPDPKTATKEGGEKKIGCQAFFYSHKFHKIENYFIFSMLKKKIWASFQRILELFTRKFVTKL